MDLLDMLKDQLLGKDLLGQIAGKAGVGRADVEETVKIGLPAMVNKMAKNAGSADGASSLSKALADHAGRDITSIDQIDMADGRKILGHIFGGDSASVLEQLGIGGQASGSVLDMLAPILMNALGKKQAADGGIGDLSAMLSGLGGSGMLDMLGGLFGGGKKSGGLLGGLKDLFGGK